MGALHISCTIASQWLASHAKWSTALGITTSIESVSWDIDSTALDPKSSRRHFLSQFGCEALHRGDRLLALVNAPHIEARA